MKSNGFIINDENRQHISLSGEAMRIIESDMANFRFDATNKSGFMNIIFHNYYDDFPLAPKVVLKNIKMIQNKLNFDGIEKRIIEGIIREFSREFMRDSIKEYAGKFGDDVKFKLKMNKENADLVKHIEDAPFFEEFAPKSALGFFLKIVFETYARLPRIQREKVYCLEKINVIEACIAKNRKMLLVDNDLHQIVKPLFINDQNKKQVNKLVFSTEYEEGIKVENVDICKVVVKETNESSDYTGVAKEVEAGLGDKIKEEIISHANLASSMPRINFKIQFTQMGMERYRLEEDEIPIKGIEQEGDPLLLVFNATESEIFYHLFKFGGQMQIIEPLVARERIKKMYLAAYESY